MVLVAHGSTDPRAAATIRALARAVTAARPGLDVRTAYLDHTQPGPVQVLAAVAGAGHRAATVVPLLLTAAYHGRVDLPGVLAAARAGGLALPVRVTGVLGPTSGVVPAPLVAGLRRRLSEAIPGSPSAGPWGRSAGSGSRAVRDYRAVRDCDAVVLAAAGTRDAAARATVDQAAAVLGAGLGVPCRAAYASAAAPTAGQAVASLRERGAGRVAMAAYFLAPGQLYEVAARSARAAGAVAVAAPLGAAAELAHLVLARLDAAEPAAADRRDAAEGWGAEGWGAEARGAEPRLPPTA